MTHIPWKFLSYVEMNEGERIFFILSFILWVYSEWNEYSFYVHFLLLGGCCCCVSSGIIFVIYSAGEGTWNINRAMSRPGNRSTLHAERQLPSAFNVTILWSTVCTFHSPNNGVVEREEEAGEKKTTRTFTARVPCRSTRRTRRWSCNEISLRRNRNVMNF